MDIDVNVRASGNEFIATVAGEVDANTAPTLRRSLDGALSEGYCDIVVEMGKVPFIDSTGIGVLAAALRSARERGGTVTLVGVRDNVLRIFALLGLDTEFTMLEEYDASR